MADESKNTADSKASETKAAASAPEKKEKNLVQEHFEAKAGDTKKNLASGGKPATISLTNKVKIEFTKDYGNHIKKGHKQEVSDTAYEIYLKQGVVKKL